VPGARAKTQKSQRRESGQNRPEQEGHSMSVYAGALVIIALFLFTFFLWTIFVSISAERAVPKIGKTLTVEGNKIHYTDEGPRDAPVLVMIHGLAGNMHNFRYALTGALSPEFRVINLDRPGSGYSTRVDDRAATLPAQARILGAFLDELGVKKPVLVGHSLGGAVSLAMALQQPEKIGGLALLCPLTQIMEKPHEVFEILTIKPKFLRLLLGYTLAAPVSKITAKVSLSQIFAPEAVPEDFMTRGGGALGSRPSTFFGAAADLAGIQASLPALVVRCKADLKTPGGILCGADDAILDPDVHGRRMQPHGLFFEELKGAGHMIPVTAPDACADFIRRVVKLAK
jgi:pimeloyl-ACP methyl ester carboxylesterase